METFRFAVRQDRDVDCNQSFISEQMLSRVGWLRFILPVVACLILLRSLIFFGDVLAFRDTLHFYYPLWHSLDARPFSDWLIPQFNLLDRVGVPLLGEPTSMVFYPLRILLKLPFLGIERSIGVFLAVHLLIAWYACYWTCRVAFLRSKVSSSISASAYAFGGAVYFSIYNPPYLISAAWLPLAFASMYKIVMLQNRGPQLEDSKQACMQRRKRWQLLLIVSLSLMCFGGDVQMPYNLAILAMVSVLTIALMQVFWNARHKSRTTFADPTWDEISLAKESSPREQTTPTRQFATQATNLLVPFAFAGLLAAIQSIPTYYWMQLGKKGTVLAVRGINDQFVLQWPDFLTWISPLILGSYTPTHTHWVSAFHASPMWTPSLHVGVLVLLSFIALGSGVRLRRIAWLCPVAIWSILCAGGKSFGLYSLIEDFAPFYRDFRYPMKWYTIAAFALCLGSSFALDFAMYRSGVRERLKKLLILFSSLNLVLASLCGILILFEVSLPQILGRNVPADALCGGFDQAAYLHTTLACSLATTAACAAIAYLLSKRSFLSTHNRWRAVECLSLLHLGFCAWQITATVSKDAVSLAAASSSQWVLQNRQIPVVLHGLGTSQNPETSQEWIDFQAVPQSPRTVAEFQSKNAVGKLHLLAEMRSFAAQLSIEPAVYRQGPQLDWLSHRVIPETEASKVQLMLKNESLEIARETSESQIEVQLPILQDGGWTSSDSRILVTATKGQLLSVRLPSQVGHAKLTYRTPGLTLGTTLSFLSFLLLFAYYRQSYV